MRDYLKRLALTGAAYQFGDILSKGFAVITLPLYLRHVTSEGYGAAESMLTSVILASIILRAGVGEAFIRFYFDDEDPERRRRIARSVTAAVAWSTSIASTLALVFASPLSTALLHFKHPDPLLIDCAVLGLWAFTNLEIAYAQLRVQERARAYIYASGANVLSTVLFTVLLVVVSGQGARGLLLGNFGASALVVLALWFVLREGFSLRVRIEDLRGMLRFGLPTVPADASVYGLQVADRLYLFRADSHAAAGRYAYAIRLATVVFVAVRGFQYAWPPLAYSVASDEEAARLYSLVTTYYTLGTGAVVCAVVLVGRWLVRLFAPHEYFGAHAALPWLALGWSLYGLYLVFLAISARARVTSRNLPAAVGGLALNITLLFALVPRGGANLGIAGAGLALCGAYVAMLAIMYALTRSLFKVGFEWRRLAQLVAVLAGVAISGELLLPTRGAAGLLLRIAWLALVPVLLVLTRFFAGEEIAAARSVLAAAARRLTDRRVREAELEAYAEDPLRDV